MKGGNTTHACCLSVAGGPRNFARGNYVRVRQIYAARALSLYFILLISRSALWWTDRIRCVYATDKTRGSNNSQSTHVADGEWRHISLSIYHLCACLEHPSQSTTWSSLPSCSHWYNIFFLEYLSHVIN
jgi:hypothetical protein